MNQSTKTRIAHLSGPTATIQNTPPLVTSNKARAKHGLPLLKDAEGAVLRHDALRFQRLAIPAKVYVEQFSAHPLESDVAELYGPPDGCIGPDGVFQKQRQNASDKAVYEIELKPEDGLYPLPYMATRANGTAWEEECTSPGAPKRRGRPVGNGRVVQLKSYRQHWTARWAHVVVGFGQRHWVSAVHRARGPDVRFSAVVLMEWPKLAQAVFKLRHERGNSAAIASGMAASKQSLGSE